ncbi:hypothetical protein DASC09_007240 [Saccharomycopsis crataegensis]|uniref:Uncharacterized protein n=1 Tax=Saccharomycopsis crataegensis TaxID=43959 RepID=A0AAV5QF81_9ASCO|nr:hypothetical protein DASC09_007240 [Saccharomycopsis crataegensis]
MTLLSSFLLLLLPLLSIVLANTESLLLSLPSHYTSLLRVPKSYITQDVESTLSPNTKLPLTLVANHLHNRELEFSGKEKLLGASDGDMSMTQYFKVVTAVNDGKSPTDGSYNIRICWPATFPVSIDIAPVVVFDDDPVKSIQLSNEQQQHPSLKAPAPTDSIYIAITYHPRFYTASSSLMLTDLKVPVHLHMVELLYGVLPVDILPIIGLLVSLFVIGLPLSGKIYKIISNAK